MMLTIGKKNSGQFVHIFANAKIKDLQEGKQNRVHLDNFTSCFELESQQMSVESAN